MASFYEDNQDLRYYVEKGIDWEPLVRLTEYNGRSEERFQTTAEALETYASILELVGSFAADEIAPRTREIDQEHPHLENGIVRFPEVTEALFEQLKGLGVHGLCLPRELGGMNAPFTLFMLCNELLSRADVSVNAHVSFHGGMAMAMLLYSLKEGSTTFDPAGPAIQHTRFEEAIAEIISGESWGSMDITEPGAGSDMGALRSVGEQDEAGQWFVTGEKIFITSGHAKFHFVVARTEPKDTAPGLDGLSMFLVKAYQDEPDGSRTHFAHFDKLEEKIGHHGSATVLVRYDKSPAELLGDRGDGFRQMLMLMNNARVGVGFESVGLCEAALRLATDYASQRPSMGKLIQHHEMIADILDEMQTDIQGLRALAVQACWHEELAQKYQFALNVRKLLKDAPLEGPLAELEPSELKKQQRRHQRKARRLTPLLKYLGAERSVHTSRMAIQVLGGYGYSSEYGAEKLMRDALVLPIYEGTSQIQCLMAMKDTLMGVMKDPRRFVESSAKALWRSQTAPDALERRVAKLQVLQSRTLQHLMTRLAGQKFGELRQQPPGRWRDVLKQWDPKRDFAHAMLHAEHLTRILADVAVCEILLEQAQKHPERAEVLERYMERAEPRCRYNLELIMSTGERLLSALDKLNTDGKES